MSEYIGHINLPGYVSIKEAATMLGLSEKTVYFYVENGRLPAHWAADVLMIRSEDVKNFKINPSGRPHKNTPPWRISSGDNTQFMLLIQAELRSGQQATLEQALEKVRKSGEHTFPGTVVRSVMKSDTKSEQITITLTWRKAVMPDVEGREAALEAFRQNLADILDWNTAHYDSGMILIHT